MVWDEAVLEGETRLPLRVHTTTVAGELLLVQVSWNTGGLMWGRVMRMYLQAPPTITGPPFIKVCVCMGQGLDDNHVHV